MDKDKIKGGNAEGMSVEDIAEKHNVSIDSIKAQIEMGKKIEREHVDSDDLSEEIAMDHLEEIPDYYTRLNKMEKEAKQELNEEAKKFMALAGIKEDNKKFLTNESFSELSKDEANPLGWKGMDAMPAGIQTPQADQTIDSPIKENEESDADFIIMEFDQIDVEPGDDDDKIYKLK